MTALIYRFVLLISLTGFFLFFTPLPLHAQISYSPVKSYTAASAGNQDDMTIWVHPSDPSLSTIIGSDKSNELNVYDLNGNVIQQSIKYLSGATDPGNIDVRYKFPLGGQAVDIVALNQRDTSPTGIIVFKVNADRTITRIDDQGIITPTNNYGFCLYHSMKTGKFYGITTAKDGMIRQYELYDNGNGQIAGIQQRNFDIGGQTEGCVADDQTASLYLAEEATGIWRYGAEPQDGTARTQVDSTGGHLRADVEGVSVYYAGGGQGYLIASSQGASKFDVYERQPPYTYVTSFKVGGASSTDGIDVTSVNLSSVYPQGVFLAHSGSASIQAVPWNTIASGENLLIDTSWDPRADSGGASPVTSNPTLIPTPTTGITVSPTPSENCLLKTSGDADCNGTVDIVDYDYYRRTVLLDSSVPAYVSADFNGDQETGVTDGAILVKALGL